MIRNLRIVSVACAVWLCVSCIGLRRDNTIPVNIAFRPVIGYDTRAEESVPFPEDQTFDVWAQNGRNGSLYLEAENIVYNDGWKSSQVWIEDELSFQACWPLDLPISYSESEGLQIKNFDCTTGDVDILLAKAHSSARVDGAVVLPFNHLLSRVEFRMRHSLSEEMSVKVRKITLKNFAVKGDYNTKNQNEWSSTDYTGSRIVFDVGDGEGVDLPGGSVLYFGDDFYAIPQVSAPYVEVVYEVRHNVSGWITQTSEVGPLDTEWDPSKHYTYTLNLRMDKMVYTTGISSWNNRE